MRAGPTALFPSFTLLRCRVLIQKYLKRRLRYSPNHLGSFNPAIITNQDAHMIYANMDGQRNSEKKSGRKGGYSKISFLRQIQFQLLVSLIVKAALKLSTLSHR